MKTLQIKLLFLILFINQAITTFAVPAYPGLIKMKQPDGTSITLYQKGDEKIRWMESEDGYSLMYDNNKTIVYAIKNENGDMIPSSVVAKDISLRSNSDQKFLKEIPQKLNYSKTQISTLSSIWEMTQNSLNIEPSQFRAGTEDRYLMCALVEFQNEPFTMSKQDFDNLMKQAGYNVNGAKGCVNEYYLENSYGKANLIVNVSGIHKLSQNYEYYGANDPVTQQESPSKIREFATEAARLAFNGLDNTELAQYDSNGNGYIDAFHIIFAGYGEEAGANADRIWSHAFGFPRIQFGNKFLDRYSCTPELRGNQDNNPGKIITQIGVICHEMCHAVFGSPDYYDVDGDANGGKFIGTGYWDLMADGCWNSIGACPAHINMYQKIRMGWVVPVVLNSPQSINDMPNSAENAVAYRYNTTTTGEFFILENRQRIGFDQYIPGSGLLIYRVSLTENDVYNNTVNIRHPQRMYPICASANTNPTGTPSSYGGINSTGCPFPGSSGKTSFTDFTIPSATSWAGANTLKPITNIQTQNGTISFKFMMQEADPVTNLQVTANDQTVNLSWDKPSEDVVAYNIYRNNALKIKIMGKNNTSYSQINVSSGNYNYCVTAVYPEKESSQVCKTLQVNSQIDGSYLSVLNLNAKNINNDKDIELNWESPFVSDWISHAGVFGTALYYPSYNQFVATTRFNVEDLQKFQGSKLTKVRFSIYNTQCKHTIFVWTKDPGLNPKPNTPIVNQLVNNPLFSNNNFEVTLNTPIELVPNKEIWIGIKYEISPMTFVAGIDKGPLVNDRNFVLYNDKWTYAFNEEVDNFNWYISGYLQFDTNLRSGSDDSWLRSTTATANNYVIYRDGEKLATTNQSNYVDIQPDFGSHIYCVGIAYDDGKESESQCVEAFSTNNSSIIPIDNSVGEIEIYPNPINKDETLVIHYFPQIVSTLSLYNISGQLIQQEQIAGGIISKKMNFEPGIYILQIKNNSNTFIRKIIIK